MDERTGFSSAQVFLAFLSGAAIGAAAAMLTTPRSGTETRQIIGAAVGKGQNIASRIPKASRMAAEAAKQTFADNIDS